MKLFGMLLSLLLVNPPHPLVMLIDTNLKKPAGQTNDFGFEHYSKKQFPVYSTDVAAVALAAEKAAKLIEHQTDFSFDTVLANRTAIVLNSDVEFHYKVITVRVVTEIEEKKVSFDFELVHKEANRRKAQKKLLDFADYLSN